MDKKMLSIKEAATMLNVSETTIRRMIKRDDIVAFKIGAKGTTSPWRISQKVIEDYIRESENKCIA
jgi:excisionase family DNA binding protein